MANSLQEQLLKVGLVKEEDLSKRRRDKKKDRKRGGSEAKRQASQRQGVRQQVDQKREEDRKLNLAKADLKRAREAKQRARQLARKLSLNDPHGEQTFHFQRNSSVKRLYVNDAQREALSAGRMVIVAPSETHYILNAGDEQQVLATMPECFVYRATDPAGPASGAASDDDAYAEFQVPDDLTW